MPTGTRISQAAEALAKSGNISQGAASRLAMGDRPVQAAELRRGFEDPVFSCFVIDASPSMEPYIDAVIQGQQRAIQTLRGSAKCRKGALYVGQWLFSTDIRLLNKFSLLDRGGNDSISILDRQCYRPKDGSGTAVYATMFHVLQDMAVNIAHAYSQNVRATFTVAIITDGEDNDKTSGIIPDQVREIISELKSKGHLSKSVVIGIESPGFTAISLDDIKTKLGFDDAIPVGKSDSEIRRAFALASQSALSGQ